MGSSGSRNRTLSGFGRGHGAMAIYARATAAAAESISSLLSLSLVAGVELNCGGMRREPLVASVVGCCPSVAARTKILGSRDCGLRDGQSGLIDAQRACCANVDGSLPRCCAHSWLACFWRSLAPVLINGPLPEHLSSLKIKITASIATKG